SIEKPGCVIELIVYLKGLRIVGQSCRILDVKNIVPEALKADDVMNVLPDHAGNRHRAHEAHHNDFLFLHLEDPGKAGIVISKIVDESNLLYSTIAIHDSQMPHDNRRITRHHRAGWNALGHY